MDFESLAKDLSNEQLDLTPGMLGQLSGLSREENEQIAEVFVDIPAIRRRKILTSLVAMSDDNIELDFLGVFCSSLADSEPDIRILAASGLWETTDRNAIAPLINTLEADQSLDVRAAAAIALAHFVELYVAGKLIERDGNKLCESLNCILEDQNIDLAVRRRALEALAATNTNSINNWIHWAYANASLDMKQSALYSMGRTCDSRWMPVILDELENEEPAIRYEAANAAREIADPEALPVLHDAVSDSDSQVAIAAVNAIGGIGGVNAKKLLHNYIENGDAPISEAAEQALKELESDESDFSMLNTHEDYIDEV